MTHRHHSLAVLLVLWPVSIAVAQVRQTDIGMTNGLTAQQYLGTGKNVIVSVIDGGVDITHPALRNQFYKQRDFTGQQLFDDTKARDQGGHGTGVAGIIVGNDSRIYSGIAPAARFLNCRVETTGGRNMDSFTGSALIWSAQSGAKVANLSVGNKIGAGRLTDKINLIADYLTERYGMNIVSAAGNESDTAVFQSPGGNYNGFSVGALGGPGWSRVWADSNWATDASPRTKPDLVAPGENIGIAAADWEKDTDYFVGTGTSFAAPMVSGVLAQMVGYGKSHKLSTSPLLLKAILLTSATKTRDTDGSRWSPRQLARDPDYGFLSTMPLDDEQGAGLVDAFAAWRIYSRSRSKSTPITLWKEGVMKRNQSVTYRLGKLGAGQRVDATIDWYRHVAIKDLDDDGVDVNDQYTQSASLADFVLTLLKDGKPVAASDSDADNLEHLSWTLAQPGDYSLQVYRFADTGLASEQFAIAARVMKGAVATPAVATPAIYDPLSGAPGMSALAPEPGALMPLLLGAAMMLRRRR